MLKRKLGRTRKSGKRGGAVIGIGGYGCVFSPPLPCKGSPRPSNDFVSKLMERKNAEDEMKEIARVKKILEKIPDASRYFSVSNVEMCDIGGLTDKDLEGMDCGPIDVRKVRSDLQKTGADPSVALLQQPNLGVTLSKYVVGGGAKDMNGLYEVFQNMNSLLLNGIIPMNELGVYHEDLKNDNILVKDGIPRIIDWGFIVVNTRGPIRDASTRLTIAPAGTNPVMRSYVMYNQPLAATYFYSIAWDGDTSGELKEELEEGLDKNDLNLAITKSLAALEDEGHFGYLRHNLLKPAMAILKDAGVTEFGPIQPSSQVVFIKYLERLNAEYISMAGSKTIDHDKIYRDFYSNVDKWGWAITFGSLLGKPIPWMSSSDYKQMQVGVAKLIYYLFTDGAIRLDPARMTKFIDEAVSRPVGYVSTSAVASAIASSTESRQAAVGSALKPRPVGSRKAEKFTPSGKLPTGMLKSLTKANRLSKKHEAYIRSLGSNVSVGRRQTSLNSTLRGKRNTESTERRRLSPVLEDEASSSPRSPRTGGRTMRRRAARSKNSRTASTRRYRKRNCRR